MRSFVKHTAIQAVLCGFGKLDPHFKTVLSVSKPTFFKGTQQEWNEKFEDILNAYLYNVFSSMNEAAGNKMGDYIIVAHPDIPGLGAIYSEETGGVKFGRLQSHIPFYGAYIAHTDRAPVDKFYAFFVPYSSKEVQTAEFSLITLEKEA